ncbi:MAG: CDP-diacylglycerol--serine O-phosphatidyltransferase [Polyangiales bacterium]
MNLKKTLFLLPNVITMASIFCGFDAVRLCADAREDSDFWRAALLLIFAMLFDTLDGRVARATKTQSAFGLQIDSLADVVSFGIAPAILVYKWSLFQLGPVGIFFSFAYAACGAIRLARFNVLSMRDKGAPAKPGKYIMGLPIPGAAGILISLVVTNHAVKGNLRSPAYAYVLLSVVIALSGFMVSTIKFRSFKDVRLNVRTVAFVAFVMISSAAISAYLKPAFVLVWLLGCYILMGVIESLLGVPKALARRRARRHGTERLSSPGT